MISVVDSWDILKTRLHAVSLQTWTLQSNTQYSVLPILGRLFDRVDPIKPVLNARLCIRTYIRPSTKSFFDFNEILEVDEWCTTVCSMTRSEVKVTSPSKLEIRQFSKASTIYYVSCQLTTDSLTRAQCLNLIRPDFYIWPSFFVTWLWSWHKRQCWRVDCEFPYGANFYICSLFLCTLSVLSTDWRLLLVQVGDVLVKWQSRKKGVAGVVMGANRLAVMDTSLWIELSYMKD